MANTRFDDHPWLAVGGYKIVHPVDDPETSCSARRATKRYLFNIC
jgi:hypothetical protein